MEKITEKFTEKNIENFFCIFFCKFFRIFFCIVFQSQIKISINLIFLIFEQDMAQIIETNSYNRLQELHF